MVKFRYVLWWSRFFTSLGLRQFRALPCSTLAAFVVWRLCHANEAQQARNSCLWLPLPAWFECAHVWGTSQAVGFDHGLLSKCVTCFYCHSSTLWQVSGLSHTETRLFFLPGRTCVSSVILVRNAWFVSMFLLKRYLKKARLYDSCMTGLLRAAAHLSWAWL